jgi:hypothetical protein
MPMNRKHTAGPRPQPENHAHRAWLWINPAERVPESMTATVPGESVTTTATPVSVTWHPGLWSDGHLPRGGHPLHQCR